MKVVATATPPGLIQWRRRIGADTHDEMWDGVLHMNPVPTGKHQDLVIELVTWLRANWARPRGCKAFNERNVARPGAWPDDFRVPDVVLLSADQSGLDKDTHIEGGPAVVMAIRSPDDESYEKLPFYFSIGTGEVWIIDRDTKAVQLYARTQESREHEQQTAGCDGWLKSDVTGIELRAVAGGKLGIRIAGEPNTYCELPTD